MAPMPPSRLPSILPATLVLIAGCGAMASSQPAAEAVQATKAGRAGAPAPTNPPSASEAAGSQSDQADGSCQVAFRYTEINFESSLGPQTDCASGTCWVVIPIVFDVAMSQDQADSQAYVLYSGADGQWHQVAATGIWGAPLGYRRYQAVLDSETFTTGVGADVVQFIPFLQTVAGQRLFDHNQLPDPLGSYQLTPTNNWTLNDSHTVCQGAAPHGIETLVFAQGWQNSGYGSLVQSGKLDINYDIYRIPQGLGCTTDGVNAVAVTGYVQFEPGGTILSERIDGPLDPASRKFSSIPLEFDVPGNATTAAVWFLDSSECTGDNWDSNYGQNYVYPVYSEAQPTG